MSAFPQFFDAREKFGYKCPGIQQIYNQGQCKAGWAVTIASVISDQICINSNGRTLKMLSAQQLLSCCKECCGCNGGIIMKAWEWVLKNGLVTGSIYGDKKSCFPYKMPPARPSKYGSSGHGGEWATVNSALPECPGTCMDGSQRSSNFSNTSYIINFEKCRVVRNYELWPRKDQFGIMEALMTHGPLQVSMHLYEDFRYYTNGIYVHKTGVFEGDHAAKLIGWGTWKSKDYWLLMNSFGNTSWGMKGTFWIPRDGTDNVEFGYAIIGPIFTSIASCTHITVIQLEKDVEEDQRRDGWMLLNAI
ncbi:cathepsin B-like cysteine proteinase 6 [Daktulosphaira vitifoliae]|uniref:cathepsin B-like cysteine proteinase 6 n=1 Tax=Daktulosphaira vitifoliae TaxID=58002 RepID=UPI0021AACB1A|nr:cathepsin B-like cysteine proteinase 6 [Daktulosphaira vitifoliae]